MLISEMEFAKYPFTKEAIEQVTKLDLKIDDLLNQDYVEIINRAEQRVEEALIEGIVKWRETSYTIELFSFPVAIFFVKAIDDEFLKRRYALAEAKRANELLSKEKEDKLMAIIESFLKWKIKNINDYLPYRFSLNFVDYLRNATSFHDDKWKLVNRVVINGNVLLKKDEVARLISEEVQKYIQRTIEKSPKIQLPPTLEQKVERLNQILVQRKGAIRFEELPIKSVSAAYPPCIKRLYDSLKSGQHLSHIGRFALTAFLLNIGLNAEELLKLYTSFSDFSERLTRYQIEHIAGKKGSGVKYIPPRCGTLKTHSLCIGSDEICSKINHPLSYYRRKVRLMKTFGENPNNG